MLDAQNDLGTAIKQLAAESKRHHATSEAEFSHDEVEFLNAIEAFKRHSGKKFPTWCDVLRVMRALGYERHGHEQADRPDSWIDLPCFGMNR
jgi:hypothetical protein